MAISNNTFSIPKNSEFAETGESLFVRIVRGGAKALMAGGSACFLSATILDFLDKSAPPVNLVSVGLTAFVVGGLSMALSFVPREPSQPCPNTHNDRTREIGAKTTKYIL